MNMTINRILWTIFFILIGMTIMLNKLGLVEYALFFIFTAIGFAILIIAHGRYQHMED